MRKCPNLILLHVGIPFPQNNLLKRLLFLHWYSRLLCHRLIDHRCVHLFLGSLLCSVDLWVHFYASTKLFLITISSVQSCPTLCDPMNHSIPGLPVHHQLPEFTQTHVHRISDAIQPSHPLSSPSPPAPNPSQHQSLFQWVNSSHEVAKVLEFQL